MSLIRYSEIFKSIQGEGYHTGVPTIWLRFFTCNLQCNGFGQKDPTDPSTYELPYKDFDIDSVKKIEDLPVWKYGCDSSYSWSAKFAHLQHSKTAEEVVDEFVNLLTTKYNPDGFFGDNFHLCFTGGEPLLPINQKHIIAILKELTERDNLPSSITFETNGTKKVTDELYASLKEFDNGEREVFFSISPKLFTVSGETNDKAIKMDVLSDYVESYYVGKWNMQFKFVMGTEQRQWDELNSILNQFDYIDTNLPIYIMPVGATEESQNDVAAEVADKAIERGYRVSARVHTYIYGNSIGK